MKIIHLPTPVGGNAWGLSRGERLLGLKSDVLVAYDNWLHYPAYRVLLTASPRNIFQRMHHGAIFFREMLKIRKQYDVFHFNFGTTLLDSPRYGLLLLDLPLYKHHGKIIVSYNGCDARQKYPTMKRTKFSACHNETCYNGMCNDGMRDRRNREKILKFDRFADAIFALNPDLLNFLPERSQFLPYTIANWDGIRELPFVKERETITIAHAPTNRAAKGSFIILKVLDQIKKIYKDKVKIFIIENRPYLEALGIFPQADIIIDQILVGWYGAIGVEAMKMGKPVLAFIREEDLHFIPPQMAEDCKNAIINANPETLFDKLTELIDNPGLIEHYRTQGLKYVNRWHDPRYVAGITKKAYES